jgi:hypothetical protein
MNRKEGEARMTEEIEVNRKRIEEDKNFLLQFERGEAGSGKYKIPSPKIEQSSEGEIENEGRVNAERALDFLKDESRNIKMIQGGGLNEDIDLGKELQRVEMQRSELSDLGLKTRDSDAVKFDIIDKMQNAESQNKIQDIMRQDFEKQASLDLNSDQDMQIKSTKTDYSLSKENALEFKQETDERFRNQNEAIGELEKIAQKDSPQKDVESKSYTAEERVSPADVLQEDYMNSEKWAEAMTNLFEARESAVPEAPKEEVYVNNLGERVEEFKIESEGATEALKTEAIELGTQGAELGTQAAELSFSATTNEVAVEGGASEEEAKEQARKEKEEELERKMGQLKEYEQMQEERKKREKEQEEAEERLRKAAEERKNKSDQ